MCRVTRRRFCRSPALAPRPLKPAGSRGLLATITDMYAKAIQGMASEEAVKWAQGELTKVYT